MYRLFVMFLISIFATSLMTGCGQNKQPQEDKKPIVVKQESAAVENIEDEEFAGQEDVTNTAAEESQAVDKAETPAVTQAPVVEAAKYSAEAVVANFNNGEKPNNLGGNFGAWNKDPADPTQWCKEGFDNVTRHGDTGFAMKLDYSVDSPNPAYNGFWMTLPNFDASNYDAVNLWVKGDPKAGYTTVFKIELKNAAKQTGRYYVSNVSDQWQEISIPLSEFKGLIDKTAMTEFVIVFEDRMASNKKGVLYIDDIRFVKSASAD